MSETLLPFIIAAAVITLVCSVWSLLANPANGEKKKIQARLSGESRNTNSPSGIGTRPITLQTEVKGVPEWLTHRDFIQALNRKLLQAHPDKTLGAFLTKVVALAVVVGGLTFVISTSGLIGIAAGLVAGYLPFMALNIKRTKRQKLICLQLPEALDFLTRVLRAGHSLSTGLQMAGEELPQPLASEFRRAYDQHSLGLSLEDSLKETTLRVDSTDFAFFVTAVLIQRQTGGDLSEVLRNIGGMIRGRVRLQQHVRAKTAEGRFTGYVLVAFPAIMFFISYTMNPDYAGVLLHDSGGQKLLGVAVGLMLLGLYAIKKITTVRV